MWRPPKWPIYGDAITIWVNGEPAEVNTALQNAFEAGANAMLEVLRAMGSRAGKFIHEDGYIKETPLIVIIPEEESNGKTTTKE